MKNINIEIPDKLKLELEQYYKKSGILQKKIVELAIAEYLKKKNKSQTQPNDYGSEHYV